MRKDQGCRVRNERFGAAQTDGSLTQFHPFQQALRALELLGCRITSETERKHATESTGHLPARQVVLGVIR